VLALLGLGRLRRRRARAWVHRHRPVPTGRPLRSGGIGAAPGGRPLPPRAPRRSERQPL